MTAPGSRVRKRSEQLLRHAEGSLATAELLAAFAPHVDPARARAELAALSSSEPGLHLEGRLAELDLAARDPEELPRYLARHGAMGVRRFEAGPARIYLLSVETFPGHINNVYLVLEAGHSPLFDVGSGSGSSRRDLALGFALLRELFGEDAALDRVDLAVISHAHLDHFGGATWVRQSTPAKIAVHELDARVLACFDERVIVASRDVDLFLRRAGVEDERRSRLIELYGGSRKAFRPVEPDIVLRDDQQLAGYRVIHVPGHCPGLICLQVHDVMLTSDHVLARITPHQFPQAITPFAGLEHYFRSLEKVRRLGGVRLALGGHEEPIADLAGRTLAIEAFHRERLRKTLEACRAPSTVEEVARSLFGEREGYDVLLALQEAGAHVEYLHDLGHLRITNVADLTREGEPARRYEVRTKSLTSSPA